MEKIYNIVKMMFVSPLHLSRGQTDSYDHSEEILHSDSLKSAIFVTAKMLFGDEIDKEFFESFKVSSAFPYKKDNFFFPKPMDRLSLKFDGIDNDKQTSKLSKKLKKLEFISKPVFEDIISDKENIKVAEKQLDKKGKFLFSAEITDEDEKTVYKSEVQQRLATAKPSKNEKGEILTPKDGTPYYIDRIYFTENSGLYFIIEYGKHESKVKAAIKLLADEGIGTDKHVGNGHFKADFDTLNLRISENSDSQMLLSLYCPLKNELGTEENNLLKQSSYQLIKRGGYIASPENINHLTFRKKSVYMFQEASVFPKEMKTTGKVVDLKPEKVDMHEVWRDGTAFTIPYIKTKDDEQN